MGTTEVGGMFLPVLREKHGQNAAAGKQLPLEGGNMPPEAEIGESWLNWRFPSRGKRALLARPREAQMHARGLL